MCSLLTTISFTSNTVMIQGFTSTIVTSHIDSLVLLYSYCYLDQSNPKSFKQFSQMFNFSWPLLLSVISYPHILLYYFTPSYLSSLSFLSMSNASSHGASLGASVYDVICTWAEECQWIVNEVILESCSGPVFLECLKNARASPDEVHDYIQQFTEQRRNQETVEPANAGQSRGGQPVGHPNANSSNPVDTATTITWALLQAKVNHLCSSSSGQG